MERVPLRGLRDDAVLFYPPKSGKSRIQSCYQSVRDNWPSDWNPFLSSTERDIRDHRIDSFCQVERFFWRISPSYFLTILYSFLNISAFMSAITVSTVWDFYDPMPMPYDTSWGRRCGEFYQYAYLFSNGRRVAKTQVYTKLDDLSIQTGIHYFSHLFFACPGYIMPIIIFYIVFRKQPRYFLLVITWLAMMCIRQLFDLCSHLARLAISNDVNKMHKVAEEESIPLRYLYYRLFLTFLPCLWLPLMLYNCVIVIAHYRALTKTISMAQYFFIDKLQQQHLRQHDR
uniref:G protein-coupled receptor n=1 Tax=Panagrellus redivivus TaxID=6233 RepID=A0A7E4W098_PANRE